MKILIIEDDTGLNRGISFALEQEGYEVFGAHSLREGEGLFEREKPDGVILDLNLPDGDGIAFCKKNTEPARYGSGVCRPDADGEGPGDGRAHGVCGRRRRLHHQAVFVGSPESQAAEYPAQKEHGPGGG